MRELQRWRRAVAVGAVIALGAAACGDGDPVTTPSETDSPSESGSPSASEGMTVADVSFDVGVTAEPCPGTPNQENGCIYLGVLSDFTGPFAPFGEPLTAGNQRFWENVNAQGGVGGLFDVVITADHIGDTGYNPQTHAEEFARIEPEVLALAQTLGTGQTLGIAADMQALDMIAAVSTWWSGWEFDANVIQMGSNYCIDAMNGVDYVLDNLGGTAGEGEGEVVQLPAEVQDVVVVYYAGDYGGDALAGVKAAADAHGLNIVAEVAQVPVVAGGDVAGAVGAILQNDPDLVWITTGPTELAQIMGGTFLQNNAFAGLYVGSHPTFNPALLQSDAGPLIKSRYLFVGPYEGYDGSSEAHVAMRATFGDAPPINDGGTFGWMMSYPLLSALEDAVSDGDLSRANLLDAMSTVMVSSEGSTPDRTYVADGSGVQRTTSIGKASASATLGSQTVEASFAGSTAAAADFSSPCATLG